MDKNKPLLVKFSNIQKFNSQFSKCNVAIAYHGDNRNFSSISKEVFENAIPSLYGIPVVGEWKENIDDYGTHGGKIEISDEGINYVETTKPIGFVDSQAKVWWEDVTEEDGTINEYMFSECFLWTGRYPETVKILEGNSPQSMEIQVDSGEPREDGYFEINSFEFSALCVLGEAVEPAFQSSGFSQFNLDKETFKAEFNLMVKELKQSLFEGGEGVDKEFEEVAEEATEEIATEPVETTEGADEFTEEQSDKTDETTVETSEETTDEKFTKVFELSHDDIRSKLYGLLYKVEEDDDDWYWINEVFSNYFVYSGYNKIYKQGYIKTDVDVAFEGERVELFIEYLTAEELEELNTMRNNYSLILSENAELKEFKAQKDKEEFEVEQQKAREEKINHINTEYKHISEEIRELFISKIDEYETKEDLDADLCVYIVKNKVTFSKAKKDNTGIKLNVEQEDQKLVMSPYGDLF